MALVPRHSLPRAIERGKVQTLALPVYDGNVLVTPTAGTWKLFDNGGGEKLSKPVTGLGQNLVSLIAGDTSSLVLGDRWYEEWTLTVDGEPHIFRREAAIVRRSVYPLITDDDLERAHPGISAYRPSSQVDWTPQRDEAWDQLQARLLGKGNRPNLIIGSWALRNLHLYWTLFLIADMLKVDGSGRWKLNAEAWAARVQAEWDSIQFVYDDADDGAPDEHDAPVPTLYLTDLPDGTADDWNV